MLNVSYWLFYYRAGGTGKGYNYNSFFLKYFTYGPGIVKITDHKFIIFIDQLHANCFYFKLLIFQQAVVL